MWYRDSTRTAPEEYMAFGHNRFAALNLKLPAYKHLHLHFPRSHCPPKLGIEPVFMDHILCNHFYLVHTGIKHG
jgi:hypothetical protein